MRPRYNCLKELKNSIFQKDWRKAYEIVRDSIRELQRSGRARRFRESFLTFMWVGMAFWVVYWFDYSRQTNAEELFRRLSTDEWPPLEGFQILAQECSFLRRVIKIFFFDGE